MGGGVGVGVGVGVRGGAGGAGGGGVVVVVVVAGLATYMEGRGRDSSQTKERRVAREQRTSQEHNRNNTFQSVTPAGRHFPNHDPKLLRLPISFPGVGPTS